MKNSQKKTSCQQGFTLIEILVVIIVIGLLAAIALPTLLSYLPNMRLRGLSRDLYSAIMQTKSEAIQRGTNVTFLMNNPPGTYAIFIDDGAGTPANANNRQIDSSEIVILSPTELPKDTAFGPADINGDGDFADTGEVADADGISFTNNALVFSLRGMPSGVGTIGVRALDSSGAPIRYRSLTVSTAGRIKTF